MSMKALFKAVLLWQRSLIRIFYTRKVILQCKSHKRPITVNGKSSVTPKTRLGSNVNFNGMRITGGGNVIIGDNFHSGPDCLFISQNHNFDAGDSIPYDSTYIKKDIFIGDNVWLG